MRSTSPTPIPPPSESSRFETLSRVFPPGSKGLIIGGGGGGDVVGDVPIGLDLADNLGCQVTVAGLSYKRPSQVSPANGTRRPLRFDEFANATRAESSGTAFWVTAASTDTRHQIHDEARVAERIAGLCNQYPRFKGKLNERVLCIDPTMGIRAMEQAVRAVVSTEGYSWVLMLDIGGDILATEKDKRTLWSPVLDQMSLQVARGLAQGVRQGRASSIVGVTALGTDGEFPLARFAEQLQIIAAAKGVRAVVPYNPEHIALLRSMFIDEQDGFKTGEVRTECSLLALKAFCEAHEHRPTRKPESVAAFGSLCQHYVDLSQSSISRIAGQNPIHLLRPDLDFNVVPIRSGLREAEVGIHTPITFFFDPLKVPDAGALSLRSGRMRRTDFQELSEHLFRSGFRTEVHSNTV